MSLSKKQKGVLLGITLAVGIILVLIAVLLITVSADYQVDAYAGLNLPDRLGVAIRACTVPTFFLTLSIGRLAKHRFFHAEDIDGGAMTQGSDQARLLQTLLQNTLEQTVLATLTYVAWASVMPGKWLVVVPLAALAFAIGRIAFFAGYRKGAPGRALGFALTFYPTLGMLASVLIALAWGLIN